MKTYLTEEGVEVSGDGLGHLRPTRKDEAMTKEPWNKHTPGDPMPCKCGDSVVEVRFHDGATNIDTAKDWEWGEFKKYRQFEIAEWRFIERKGEDVIAADPYDALEWPSDPRR